MKITTISRVHFVGVGGIGMSALARLFLYEGKQVSGSDRVTSPITEALVKEGLAFNESQVATNITDDIDLVIYTEAMPHNHEELMTAREKSIPTINYFEALGMVANEYYLIAVAGSHGKTTTTAMLTDIFEDAGLDPSAIIGSLRAKTKSNYRPGKSKYFIVEACEYKRDFLSLRPDMLVITNIEHEHVDYYKNLEEVQKAFRELAEKVSGDGFIIVNNGDKNLRGVTEDLKAHIVDYTKFFNPTRKLTMPGVHNQMNAAAAIAVAAQVGISVPDAEKTLTQFAGTWRRFEYKGKYNGAKVYDDYGHHPTEIKATIAGARELYPEKEITVIFQSHTYTRTHELFQNFVEALSAADHSILLPIYAAREENVSGVSHTKLAEELQKKGAHSLAFDSIDETLTKLKGLLSEKDVLITMGAGDMTPKIAEALVS